MSTITLISGEIRYFTNADISRNWPCDLSGAGGTLMFAENINFYILGNYQSYRNVRITKGSYRHFSFYPGGMPNGLNMYFNIVSNNITIDGNNYTINIGNTETPDYVGQAGWDGLFNNYPKQQQTLNLNAFDSSPRRDWYPLFCQSFQRTTTPLYAYSNIIIKNIKITQIFENDAINIATAFNLSNAFNGCMGGWICRSLYGFNTSGCKVINCHSTETIKAGYGGGGGIVGAGCCAKSWIDNSSNPVRPKDCFFIVENCTVSGALYENNCGGIYGDQTLSNAELYAINCSYTGNVRATVAANGDSTNVGGIFGRYYTPYYASGTKILNANSPASFTAINCFTTGVIGVIGGQGQNDPPNPESGDTWPNGCYNTGGIFSRGQFNIDSNFNKLTAINCYSTGAIKLYAGGIFGSISGFAGGAAYAINCFSTGSIDRFAGGIFGSECGMASKIPYDGISLDTSGVLAAWYTNYGICKATNCFSTGTIAPAGGGIFGAYANKYGVAQITAENCYSTGIMNSSINTPWSTTYYNSSGLFGMYANIGITQYTNGKLNGYPIIDLSMSFTLAKNCYTSSTYTDFSMNKNDGIYASKFSKVVLNQGNFINSGAPVDISRCKIQNCYAAKGNWRDTSANLLLDKSTGAWNTGLGVNKPWLLSVFSYKDLLKAGYTDDYLYNNFDRATSSTAGVSPIMTSFIGLI